ncbi:putative glycolipid transfer protein [Hyaloraphidium curvatum]|nr:putative glycolipid transfer protein [Hyaloraphidium curvatum]
MAAPADAGAATTYFDKFAITYVTMPIDEAGGIPTPEFIQATKAILGLFDLLGSVAFSPVKSDFDGNIKKIETRYNANKEGSKTLQELVQTEWKEKKRTATEGMMWLRRGLEFVSAALSKLEADDKLELSTAFSSAYKETLSQYHSFLIKPIFSAAMGACPYRKDFFTKLGSPADKVNQQFGEFVPALAKVVKILDDFYKKGTPRYEDGPFS